MWRGCEECVGILCVVRIVGIVGVVGGGERGRGGGGRGGEQAGQLTGDLEVEAADAGENRLPVRQQGVRELAGVEGARLQRGEGEGGVPVQEEEGEGVSGGAHRAQVCRRCFQCHVLPAGTRREWQERQCVAVLRQRDEVSPGHTHPLEVGLFGGEERRQERARGRGGLQPRPVQVRRRQNQHGAAAERDDVIVRGQAVAVRGEGRGREEGRGAGAVTGSDGERVGALLAETDTVSSQLEVLAALEDLGPADEGLKHGLDVSEEQLVVHPHPQPPLRPQLQLHLLGGVPREREPVPLLGPALDPVEVEERVRPRLRLAPHRPQDVPSQRARLRGRFGRGPVRERERLGG